MPIHGESIPGRENSQCKGPGTHCAWMSGDQMMLRELVWVGMVVIAVMLESPSRDVLQAVKAGYIRGQGCR